VWGVVRDGVLILTGEHYSRGQPLDYHARALPRDVQMWYADPSGATEIAEFRSGDFKLVGANNSLRPGIAAVSARLENGGLRVMEGKCPNLLAEAGLYRYGDEGRQGKGETPVDEHNHALAALRYLIMGLDCRKMARVGKAPGGAAEETSTEAAKPEKRRWLSVYNEFLWEGDGTWKWTGE
jgi:hypothetical protein